MAADHGPIEFQVPLKAGQDMKEAIASALSDEFVEHVRGALANSGDTVAVSLKQQGNPPPDGGP